MYQDLNTKYNRNLMYIDDFLCIAQNRNNIRISMTMVQTNVFPLSIYINGRFCSENNYYF